MKNGETAARYAGEGSDIYEAVYSREVLWAVEALNWVAYAAIIKAFLVHPLEAVRSLWWPPITNWVRGIARSGVRLLWPPDRSRRNTTGNRNRQLAA